MATMKKLLCLMLSLCMLLGMASAMAEAAVEAPAEEAVEREADTLIIGYTEFNEKFSPFYAESGYDMDVTELTGVTLMETDRQGGIVYNGIEGEVIPYNGTDYTYTSISDIKVERNEAADTTTYTAKLKEGVLFSDGVELTADDVIFNYYVVLDPSYVGIVSLNSYDILGLKAYQTQTPDDIYAKYETIVNAIYAAGADHVWAEGDAWTKEQQDGFWASFEGAWKDNVTALVNHIMTNYLSYAADVGFNADDITANADLQVAFSMALWGFAEYDGTVLKAGDKTWTLTDGDYPTVDDYYAATYAAYEGDSGAFFDTELAGDGVPGKSALAAAQGTFISEQAKAEPEAAAGVPSIEGIKKLDKYTVEVTVKGFSAPAIYSLFGFVVAPMHYYGDSALYDYENGKFGFPFGDLSIVNAKTTQPLGAGPYKFVKYENKVVYLEANETFWKGAPKIKNLQLKETADPDKIPGVLTGTLDIANEPSFNSEAIASIKQANGGELNGPVFHTETVDNLGYGYIGATATQVCVGGEPGSDASKNLRRAYMTALSLYRDVVVDSYYGEIASVINYPISNTSWAAPQKTDADYKVAFSTDIDGKDIYTADMTMEQKEEAALQAIIGYLKAAGYTFDEATGKFTAAPEGAEMEYEAIVSAYGVGDHPSFGILTDAKGLLEKIGIGLIINDLADFSIMMDKVKTANAQFFCMAWGATIDPDMYQVYHSSNIIGAKGTESNQYMLTDDLLDQYIMDGRNSPDQSYRKAVYKAALDRIIDWAVELPVYQRQNCQVFSSERVNVDSITPDCTTFWEYDKAIELLELK